MVVACLVDRLNAQTSTGSGIALDAMPRELEVKLALSALPPHLRSEANVYVLDPAKGYVLERQGKDNFTCFVERTDWVREDFRNDLFIPGAAFIGHPGVPDFPTCYRRSRGYMAALPRRQSTS